MSTFEKVKKEEIEEFLEYVYLSSEKWTIL